MSVYAAYAVQKNYHALTCKLFFQHAKSSLTLNVYGLVAANANMKKDKEIMEEVLKHLRTMRDTWKEVMKLAHTQQ